MTSASFITHMKVFKRKELQVVVAANYASSVHLLVVMGLRIVQAVKGLTVDPSKL